MKTSRSDTELMLDVGQAQEIKLAARRAGATNDDLKRLSDGDMFTQILPVLRGLGKVNIMKHCIDCDTETFRPKSWSILSSKEQLPKRVQGKFVLNKNIGLYLPEEQKNVVSGNRLRELIQEQPVLPDHVLDYLLANPHLIPEEWKGKLIFFWGTIYRGPDGYLVVRYLYWSGVRWDCNYYWLVSDFSAGNPAAVLAS